MTMAMRTTNITTESAGMHYENRTESLNMARSGISSDFATVFAALDRIIAEGGREIARLEEVLAGIRADRSGCERETASGAESGMRLFEASRPETGRRPDVVIPSFDEKRAGRRRAA
jgi:hypothetical protein